MIAENLLQVQQNIAAACARAKRNPAEVTLIAVSKTHPAEAVLEAVAAGVQHFGENRVEEAENKIPAVNGQTSLPLTWHMIGHIQSRKAKDIVPLFNLVHSVDTLKLAGKLSGLALEADKKLDVLLEVNISGEEIPNMVFRQQVGQIMPVFGQPYGKKLARCWRCRESGVRGLMTMAPIVDDAEQARPVFADLARLRLALAADFKVDLPDLSMGMTDDYLIAVEEGATLVRVGRAIFGERETRI